MILWNVFISVPSGCMKPFPKRFLYALFKAIETGQLPQDKNFNLLLRNLGVDADEMSKISAISVWAVFLTF